MSSPLNALKIVALNPRSTKKETSFSSPKKITEIIPTSATDAIENKYPGFSKVAVDDPDCDNKAASDIDSDDSIAIDLSIEVELDDVVKVPVNSMRGFDKTKESNGVKTSPKATIVREKVRAVSGRDTPGNGEFKVYILGIDSFSEANNLLVQLICSQKDLKTPNWHDVVKAINSNPGGNQLCY